MKKSAKKIKAQQTLGRDSPWNLSENQNSTEGNKDEKAK
jgi:hypothetical protein